jgi:preprotein translocase subunit SecA
MFKKIAQLFSGDPHKRKVESLKEVIDQINALESEYEALSDEALAGKTGEFKARLAGGETLDDLLVETFAVVREASKRTLGQRHYDVQLITGITLHRGEIAEMKTGEGKTLAATLPLYLNALMEKGAHLVTVNDYLARRDGRWMGKIFRFLGLEVGILQMAARTEHGRKAFVYDPEVQSAIEDQNQLRMVNREEAYRADITYGTNNEFGFDYLRDNLAKRKSDRVQRGHFFAIIDEVDNILIDEARTPLIISGPAHEDTEWYQRMAQIVKQLVPEDYEVSEKDRTVTLSEIGLAHVEELLGQPLRDPERPEDITPEQARLLGFLEQALRAEFLFHRNKDYIVQNNEVVIVDEFTGRLMPGRRWSDGLHQSVEAKEGVKIQAENVTYATITIQNYFRMYEKLAGMTGTALTESEEFYKIYGLEVLPIPTNLEYRAMSEEPDLIEAEDRDEYGYKYSYYYRPEDPGQTAVFWKRKDYPDVVYRSEEAKLRAIVREIITYHVLGRPQLVGTTSVENSEHLSSRLSASNVRRLTEVLLIRHAYIRHQNLSPDDVMAVPELAMLHDPLDQLRSPELRRLGREYGMTSLSPLNEENQAALLEIFDLEPEDWPRLESVIKAGVSHEVLNARKHTEESLIIAGAGAFGAVTIATNMAGRGVDIKLGGELPEERLTNVNRLLAEAGFEDPYNMRMQERLKALQSVPEESYGDYEEDARIFLNYMEEMRRVRELGGLHVIGSERHEARRIDNQLRGRAARQGDPGSSRFYLSFEDDLMRLFGGAQAEAMLARLNFDEDTPIEIGLVGRLIEQSQTRVEGANFDVRKHLLEYDDVLNAQRERIYEQRDRIFEKEDLREDVTDMLRTEISRRVEVGMQDEEGPWKLLAYLNDIQPPMDQDGVVHSSFPYQLMMNRIGQSGSPEALRKTLLSLAADALTAWHGHLKTWGEILIQRSKSGYESQLSERLDGLDAFVEGLRYDDTSVSRDVSKELSNLVRVPLRLDSETISALREGSRGAEDEIRQQIRATLMQIFVRRLILTFESRLNDNWNLKASDLMSENWGEVEGILLERLSDTLQRRSERMLGEDGEIARDLDANQELLESALEEPGALMRLLILMTQGRVITFDERSHKRQFKATRRLTYIFLAAHELEQKPLEEIQKQVLLHLEEAQDKLCLIWGQAEIDRLHNAGHVLAHFSQPVQDEMRESIGEDVFARVKDSFLNQLSAPDHKIVAEYLGRKAQNRLYRQLLLSKISELWVDYLTKVEALRVSVRMEAYGQRDPLVQYKSQASTMFGELLSDIRAGVIDQMFRARLVSAEEMKQIQAKAQQAAAQQAEAQQENSSRKRHKKKGRKRH